MIFNCEYFFLIYLIVRTTENIITKWEDHQDKNRDELHKLDTNSPDGNAIQSNAECNLLIILQSNFTFLMT